MLLMYNPASVLSEEGQLFLALQLSLKVMDQLIAPLIAIDDLYYILHIV